MRYLPTYLCAVLATCAVLVGCGSDSTGTQDCSPAGFVTCGSGNRLVTCNAIPGQEGENGMAITTDCTTMGQFCLDSGSSASCGAPVIGKTCTGKNLEGCGAADQLMRCVWVSEQPQPGISGDIGVWRVKTDCKTSSQVCAPKTSKCAAP